MTIKRAKKVGNSNKIYELRSIVKKRCIALTTYIVIHVLFMYSMFLEVKTLYLSKGREGHVMFVS
jgi:hypothetical protein